MSDVTLTEDEAWAIWKSCGKLAGVDYYDYAMKVIAAYKEKNKPMPYNQVRASFDRTDR